MTSPTIVLIHGAFEDASSWQPGFERLVGEGHTVLAPNPLRGLPYDASYTASIIDLVLASDLEFETVDELANQPVAVAS